MNFYKRFIGDYARDTAHLSLAEHGAYTVLLDTCYATEKPLPADLGALYRICRASSASERAAVKRVADQFFPVGEGGERRNNRVGREIANAHAYADAQAMRAHKRWHKPDGMQRQCPNDASHSHSQTPEESKSKALSGKPDPNGRDYSSESREVLDYLNRATGRSYRAVESNLKLIAARLKSGVSPTQVKEVVLHKFDQWKGDPKMDEYLRPKTLFNATNFEQYLGEINGMPQVQ